MDYVIVFPNQLFEHNELIDQHSTVFLIEHPVFFTMYNYHKLKLILHRASMKYYEDFLKNKYKCKVHYIDFNKSFLTKLKNKIIHMYDVVDHYVDQDINKKAKQYNFNIIRHSTPGFLNKMSDMVDFLLKKNQTQNKEENFDQLYQQGLDISKNINSFSHHVFYIWMRKKCNVLMKGKRPIGDKWSFDTQNRIPFPKDFETGYDPKNVTNKYIKDAQKYVEKNFQNNPGEINFYLPIDHNGTKKHVQEFLKKRFACFGPYQDAVDKNIPFGCHSVLSPLMNIGLITPDEVVKMAQVYGKKYKVPIASQEGYIRQLIGWREYTRLIYTFKHQELIKHNYFNHKNKLNEDVWYHMDGDTGFDVIDDLIKKTIKYAYLHHIERLMYIGNFLLINKTDPKDVHDWFMSMNVDSYHVFMEPNVYGMSQHSCGNLMMNRPYFSSSSYIAKMSSYKKNNGNMILINNEEKPWFEIWDALYYNFIADHKEEFSKNYAISAQVKHWNNKDKKEQLNIKKIASIYMNY